MLIEAETPPSVISSTYPAPASSIMDIGHTVRFIKQISQKYDSVTSSRIGVETIKEDLKALTWEATGNVLPNTFFYKINHENGQVKMVHQSDLHWNRDIMEGVSPHFRRGLEYSATKQLREEILAAPVGQSRFLISSRRDDNESIQDCPYTDTHLDILERVSDDLIKVRQFQSPGLNRLRSTALFNLLDAQGLMNSDTNIDTLITSIGKSMKHIDTIQVLKQVGFLTNQDYSSTELIRFKRLEDQINLRAERHARMIYLAIQNGIEGEALEQLYGRLLVQTAGLENLNVVSSPSGFMSVSTSCGFVNIGSPRTGLGWMVSLFGQSETVQYEKGDCKNKDHCGGENVEIGPCTKLCRKCEP